MESTIRNISEGKIEYDIESLDLSCHKIELSILKGEKRQGSIWLASQGGKIVKGTVCASDMRMTCLTTHFEGTEAEIFYSFRGEGLEEGDVHKGEIVILSSAGEYTIPYVVTVDHGELNSSIGVIRSLFHFANLAKTNWAEAVQLFYHPAFSSVFHGSDSRFLETYLGLSKTRGNEQNMDEFLVAIGKKEAIDYIPMEDSVRMEEPIGVVEGRITLTRNGWGYTALAIETEGDFLYLEHNVLTDDDFLGNICNFAFLVDSAKLHAGNNFGQIRIYNATYELCIPVLISKPLLKGPKVTIEKEIKELNARIIECYLDFRMKKISSENWMEEMNEIVDRLMTLDENSVPHRLFQAQMCITQEKYNEARWILERAENDMEYGKRKPEQWCYYLYLTILLERSDLRVEEVAKEVEQIFVRNPENWRIAWLLLYLREEFSKSPYKKWMFLEHQYYENCTSPMLYAEAISLLNANPTLMMKLSEYEIQVLNYAAKKDVLKRDVILQIHALAGKVKNYSPRLEYILEKCYSVAEDDESLQLICSYLMKGNRVDEKAFSWYALGVEREIRVTKLYEYYMMSMPENYSGDIPRIVLMYFAFHSELEYSKKAFLYRYILKNAEKNPEIALDYQEPMEYFVMDQMKKGHIDKNLAALYRELVTPEMLTDENVIHFIPLLFSHVVTVLDKQVSQIVLCYDKLKGESIYPVVRGKAIVPIYGSEYTIFLQAENGNRFVSSEKYLIEKLMLPGRFVKEISAKVKGHVGLDMYLCENHQGNVTITDKNAESFARLWESERITDSYRKEIRLKLAEYYYENDCIEELDAMLGQVSMKELGVRERAAFAKLLISRGMLEKAYEWLCTYGVEQTDLAVAVKLISRLLIRTDFAPDEKMRNLAFYVFKRGKYDENVLHYLVAYYEGSTKDMRDIWKAAVEYELDCTKLCERILVQMMFTGCFIGERNELFFSYIRLGAKKQVEVAFLTQAFYDYFIRRQLVDERLFPCLTKMIYRGEEFHDVCKLAYLKYYSERLEQAGEEVLQLVRKFLDDFVKREIYFQFFTKYESVSSAVRMLCDKTIVEYHATPSSRVTIHYVIADGEEEAEYVTEPMKNMYQGIFVQTFVLFFGEKLQYYITEELAGDEQLSESDTVSRSETTGEAGDSGYSERNDLIIARTLEDYNGFCEIYDKLSRKKYLAEKLFPIS